MSVLPIISKAYERVMHNQLYDYFNDIFKIFLAAFCKGFGCQSTLLRLLEDWKKALRAGPEAIDLLSSYLSDRVQPVRLGSHTSTLEKILKGVPQVSILGPLLFNVFLNDVFYFINQGFIYSNADDNTLSFIRANTDVLKKSMCLDPHLN